MECELGTVDIESRVDHYTRHRPESGRITVDQVEQAIRFVKPRYWRWSWSDRNGLRYTGVGQTNRGRTVLLVLVPDDRTFDRYTMVDPLTYGEYWDECRYWLLVTAFLIENS